MDYVNKITQEVQKKLKQKHNLIVVDIYRYILGKHNSFCGCNYCKLLKEYVLLKKSTYRVKKYLYDEYDIREELRLKSVQKDYILQIKELKLKKDKLKEI